MGEEKNNEPPTPFFCPKCDNRVTYKKVENQIIRFCNACGKKVDGEFQPDKTIVDLEDIKDFMKINHEIPTSMRIDPNEKPIATFITSKENKEDEINTFKTFLAGLDKTDS